MLRSPSDVCGASPASPPHPPQSTAERVSRLRRYLTHRRSDLLALATMVGAITLYFWPWLSLRVAFYQVDLAFMDHPTRFHAFELIRAGRFPFWTDAILCGFPLFAEGQAGVLYPFSYLYLLLPAEAALTAFIVLHFLILGVGMYTLLRQHGLASSSSLFGSLTLTFSSFTLVEHILPCFLSVAAWVPLLLLLLRRFLASGRPRWLLGAAALVALTLLAGDPLGALIAALLAVLYVGMPGTSGVAVGRRRRLAGILVPLLLGVLLAAVQLVPTGEFLLESTRRGGAVLPRAAFVPGEALLTAVSPRFLGLPADLYIGPTPPGWEETLFFFVGWAPLFAIPFGLRRRSTTTFWLLAALASVALCLRELQPLSRFAWAVPPLALFRWPARILLWYAMAMGMLAAHGFERLHNPPPAETRPPRRLALVAFLGLASLTLLGRLRGSHLAGLSVASRERLLATRDGDLLLFACCWLVCMASVWIARRHPGARLLVPSALFATLIAGIAVGYRPSGVPRGVYASAPPTARFVREAYGPATRVLPLVAWGDPEYPGEADSLRARFAGLSDNAHLLFGLHSIGQFDLPWTSTLERNRSLLAPLSPAVFDLLAVDAVIAPRPPQGSDTGPVGGLISVWDPVLRDYEACFHSDGIVVYCRRRREARAFLAHRFVVVPEREARIARVRGASASLRELVVLDRAPEWPRSDAGVSSPQESVTLVEDTPSRVVLDVRATSPALLVLADSYYPGWEARIDGARVEILPANGFIRAIAVPAGAHKVDFSYVPRAFRLGLTLSLLGLALTAGLWVLDRARQSSRRLPIA